MASKKKTPVKSSKRSSTPPPEKGVELVPLASLKPNAWNPNSFTAFERESLKFGIRTDGWLASHALTVWGKDDKGKQRDLIIDGEHRWKAALELGMTHGPAYVVDGLSEAQAKRLTIKLDAKRGKFDEESLKKLIVNIAPDLDLETRSLDLGLSEDQLAGYLATEEERMHIAGDDLPSGQTSSNMQVQLFFTPEVHEEFNKKAKELAVRFKTETMADTIFEVMKWVAALR